MSIREEVLSRAIRKLTASGECVTPAHTCLQRGLDRRDPERMCNFCYGMFAMAWQPERPDDSALGGSTKTLESPR